jgi:hypothetical protein
MSENDGWRPVQLEGEADFRKWVERKVAMLQAKGMETLVEMVSRLPGVYPTDVRDALERLDISRRSKKLLLPESDCGAEPAGAALPLSRGYGSPFLTPWITIGASHRPPHNISSTE